MSKGMPEDYEPPEYPSGCCFMLCEADLEKAGLNVGGAIHATTRFSLMGEVTSVFEDANDCRVELCVKQFAGEDGKLFDLEMPGYICLRRSELDKLDIDADAERGDTLHLIGTARLESRSDTEYGGKSAALQIIEADVEDESQEARSDA